MTGVIMALYGSYGFIRDENDDDRFFSARNVRSERKASFDSLFAELQIGDKVSFEPYAAPRGGDNGLRAKWVRKI